jgi:cytochrome b
MSQAKAVRLWDGPVRLFHWALVLLLAFSWWSGEEEQLEWHRWSGYAVLALVVFRIYWGFAGTGAARFSAFVRGPGATLAYMRTLASREPSRTPGHNPVGGLSIVAILAVLCVQVTTGLFAVDNDAIESGPLSHLVSYDVGRALAEVHEISFHALQILAAVHIGAVLYYLVWKRTNLIGAMITGRRALPSDPSYPTAPLWRLAVGVAFAVGLAWFVSKGLKL